LVLGVLLGKRRRYLFLDGVGIKDTGSAFFRALDMLPEPARVKSIILASLRIHEATVTRKLTRLHGILFVDVGAHIGLYARGLRNYNRVIALEPHPANYAALRRHIASAQLEEDHQQAMANRVT
jgi:hypothetical protein